MTAPLMVDAESVVRYWLEQDTGTTTVTETDNKLQDNLPQQQVTRIGGPDDGIILDRAMISIHSFAATRIAAKQAAYEARQSLYAARGQVINGAVITRVATIGGPSPAYTHLPVYEFVGTYQVFIKTAL